MSHCVRIGPLIMVALLAMKARWLIGLFSGPAPRAAAAPATASAGLAKLAAVGGALVSQVFLWLFALLALALLGGLVSMLVGEIRLRREFRAGAAWRRPERTGPPVEPPWHR